MYAVLGGMDVSNSIQDQGITRGTVERLVKTRITLGGKKYKSTVKKLSYNLKFDPMPESDLKTLIETIDADCIGFIYRDPILGLINKQFIPTVEPVELILEDNDGVSYWSGLEVNLEEQ